MAERKRKTEKAETEAKAEEAKDDVAAEEAQAEAAESEQQAEAEAVDAPEAEAPEAEEPEAEEADADEAEAPADEAKPSRRRGSAETAARSGQRKQAPKVDGEVVVRARARYVRSAPRKARLVMDHIRGRPVEQARAMLTHTPRAISTDILKLLDSAIANAESAYELGADELRVRRAYVDEGPTIKRYRPRALGRATRINKRTSHMTIELTSGEGS
jgi:large subunit ribosomal protein L22